MSENKKPVKVFKKIKHKRPAAQPVKLPPAMSEPDIADADIEALLADNSLEMPNSDPDIRNIARQTAAPQTQAPAPAEPQKTVYLSQNPKKETETFQGMTVAQKLNYLRIKDKRGIITPEERQLKEECEKQLKEQEGGEGNITPEDGTKVQEEEKDPKDIFKEQDIIQYMYNDWLLGGANWLYKKCYKYIDKKYNQFKNRCRKNKNSADAKKYNTISTRDTIDDKAVKMFDGSKAAIEKGRDAVKSILSDIAEGKIDGSKATGFTKILMNEMPERERQAFCASAMEKIQNLAENMKTIQFMAGQLARAQMAETLCKNQDAFKNVNPVQLFEAMSKRNAILIARQMDELEGRGGNPASFMKDMEKQIEKANEFADKQYKKHKFDEAGKDGATNPTLTKINERLGLKREEMTKSDRLEPKSMLEHLVATNKFEDLLTKQLEGVRRQESSLEAQQEAHNNRRQNFEQRRAAILQYRESIRSPANPHGYIAGDRRGSEQARQQSQQRPAFNMDAYRLAREAQGAAK